MNFTELIYSKPKDLAFIVGNGINRFSGNSQTMTWNDLLIELWAKFSHTKISQIPQGISMTEFYDLLDLETKNSFKDTSIQKEVSNLLEEWIHETHHTLFLHKAKELNTPVLTTNFDLIFPDCLELAQFHTNTKGFTDYYPWTTYYGNNQLEYPTDDFGVWFINDL